MVVAPSTASRPTMGTATCAQPHMSKPARLLAFAHRLAPAQRIQDHFGIFLEQLAHALGRLVGQGLLQFAGLLGGGIVAAHGGNARAWDGTP